MKSQRNEQHLTKVFASSEKRLDTSIFCFNMAWRVYCFASFDVLLHFLSLSLLSLLLSYSGEITFKLTRKNR